MDKEKLNGFLQQFLSLDPIVTGKLAPKLKPYAKLIYWALLACLFLALLGSIVSLFHSGFTAFVLELLLITIIFGIVRMFCEYLNKD